MLAGSPAAPSCATSGWGWVLLCRRETVLRAIDITSVKFVGGSDDKDVGDGGEGGGGRVVFEKTE